MTTDAVSPNPYSCGQCKKNPPEDDHTCPYAEDILGDCETECNCCKDCERECAMAI